MMLSDSIDVTFVYEDADFIVVPVRVQLVGRVADESRPVNISVSSGNAVEGKDYILPEDSVLPAGASEMN